MEFIKLTHDSSVEDAKTYLVQLAQSPFHYHLDDSLTDDFNWGGEEPDPETLKVMQANADILWWMHLNDILWWDDTWDVYHDASWRSSFFMMERPRAQAINRQRIIHTDMTREEKMDRLIQAEIESMSREDLLRIASEQLFAEYRDESDEYIDEQYARHDFTTKNK